MAVEVEAYRPRPIGGNWLSCFVCGGIKDGVSDLDGDGKPAGDVVKSKPCEDGVHYSGGYHSVQPDMSAYVDDKKSGESVVAMFKAEDSKAFLDFRPSEPDYVQVKVGACETHLPNLVELQRLASAHNTITPKIIREAKGLVPAEVS